MAAGLGIRATSTPGIQAVGSWFKHPGDEQSWNPNCLQLVRVVGRRAILESRLLAAGLGTRATSKPESRSLAPSLSTVQRAILESGLLAVDLGTRATSNPEIQTQFYPRQIRTPRGMLVWGMFFQQPVHQLSQASICYTNVHPSAAQHQAVYISVQNACTMLFITLITLTGKQRSNVANSSILPSGSTTTSSGQLVRNAACQQPGLGSE